MSVLEQASAHGGVATSTYPSKNYLTSETTVKSWLLTTDHKRIAILYMVSITFFFIIGGIFALYLTGIYLSVSAAILDPAEQERRAVRKESRAGVEHRVHRIGPVRRGENGVRVVSLEESLVNRKVCHYAWLTATAPSIVSSTVFCAAFQRTSSARISTSASRKESVDSAPSFSLMRSAWSASRQPPVSGS